MLTFSGSHAADFVRADSLINASISDGIVPGAVACVVKDGKVIYLKAYGNMQILPTSGQASDMTLPKPMIPDALFDMASCTKVVVTTTAILQLYERGLVDLGAPVGRYLKEFEGQDVTVTDLLTHTSGIKWGWSSFFKKVLHSELGDDPARELTLWLADPVNRKPRATVFKYSCANFFLLQLMVERITGERICDYAQKNIFDRLGMKDSYFFTEGCVFPEGVFPRIVAGNVRKATGRVDDDFAWVAMHGNAGNAGLFSTAQDLAIFVSALMNGGANGHGRILKARTVRMMAKVVDPRFGRAMGWDVCSSDKSLLKGHAMSPEAIVHGGHTGQMIAVDLKKKYAIILLANRSHPNNKFYDQWQLRRVDIATCLGPDAR